MSRPKAPAAHRCWAVAALALGLLFVPIGLQPTAEAAEPAAAESQLDGRRPWSIRMVELDGGGAAFEVTAIDRGSLGELAKLPARDDRWPKLLAVYVVAAGRVPDDQPAMLGKHEVAGERLRFTPRFGVESSARYRIVFDPGRLPRLGEQSAALEPVVAEFSIPAAPEPDAALSEVSQVFPSAGTLPENQLKFYIHFSAPMRRGEAYQHLSLLGPTGEPVELPFLELGEELWDPAGRRFTVFFDPGRIKRGLKPREEVGPVLEEGKRYTLAVDAAWRDAEGRSLRRGYRKEFDVGPPDDQSPDPGTWELEAPAAGSREAVRIRLPEPLDHALLMRVVRVADAEGDLVAGRVAVSDHETLWQFTPRRPWRDESYSVLIDTRLEDLAGNSIGRPFEVDLVEPVSRAVETSTVKLPFRPRR
ncbi:MAG: hypothetical protein WD847_13965 [Pirellulales bacterium]